MNINKFTTIAILLTQILIILSEILANQNILEVQVNQGILRGMYQKSRKGRQFCAFIGIPYAQPPVGELRFKPPLPAEPWEGILNATASQSVCPQRKGLQIIGNEDCLYLNVYTPQLPINNNQLLPVMFFIHGGGFVVGSGGPEWYEPNNLLDKDIVLVTSNYRLGALGFLSTGDKVVPGNNGLKDLVQVLKWIKNNIAAFGGNPNNITVFGHSSGATAAHYLMLSSLSKDLINGAIVQSGTALDGWCLARNNEEVKNTKKLAKFLNCTALSNKAVIECIKKINVDIIVKQDAKFLEWSINPAIVFKPVVEPKLEGAFLTQHPAGIIKSGKAANVPLLIGLTTQEGALKSAAYYNNSQLINDIDQDFNRAISLSLGYNNNNEVDKKRISRQLRHYYFGNKKIDNSTKDKLTNMFTDVLFLLGADKSVRLHGRHGTQPVFYYHFGYRGTESHSTLYGDSTHDYGVCHGDDLLYLFDLKRKFPNY
ncbi:hypothetical protein ILUMI_03376 [Ignelater luminosus]|uniref:Carboxylic ester hydrolase n=1 Tax=Ignelater luminosus TaxID=2038154 RepID=A0A8K0DGE3_IGNLU|nr:hypothetical protein ILUMI_03376 [Ignelater luminosus]